MYNPTKYYAEELFIRRRTAAEATRNLVEAVAGFAIAAAGSPLRCGYEEDRSTCRASGDRPEAVEAVKSACAQRIQSMTRCPMCGHSTNRKSKTIVADMVSKLVFCARCHSGILAWLKNNSKECIAATRAHCGTHKYATFERIQK